MVSNEIPSNIGVEIIGLSPDKWEVYKEIRLRSLREDPQAFGSNLAREEAFTQERWMERVSNPFNVVAMDKGKPIGTMGAFVTENAGIKTAHVVGVFVANEARGKGVGTMLLGAVL
ncbi:MAG: GNAT family N-acetyltransferase, partial [Patescibacteria group bacterium]